MEKWKPITGYDAQYEISNTGTVKSLERIVGNHTGEKIIQQSFLKPSVNHKGYKVVYLSNLGNSTCFSIHRLVATHFIPNPENKPQVNHIDGNKLNNNDWNLEWNTAKENMTHASQNGLMNPLKGEDNTASVLTEKEVIEILNLYRQGLYSHKKLSIKYGVSECTIGNVVNRKNWKHIKIS